jgi:RING-box protein 1
MNNTDLDLEILECRFYPVWTFDVVSDICAICKNPLVKKCISCMNKFNILNNKCKSSSGTCGHAFHYHCINTWLRKRGNNTCPIDKVPWSYAKQNLYNEENWRAQLKKNNC